MLGCAPKVSFLAVLANSDFETSDSVFGVFFAVDLGYRKLETFDLGPSLLSYLEAFYHSVGSIVGFFEVLALDGSGFLKGETSLSHEALHTECIGCFDIEIGCIHIFIFTSAEETKSTARRGQSLVCLCPESISTSEVGMRGGQ